MKQLAQNLRTGKTALLEVPSPIVRKGCILIRTTKSLVSTGTERMLVEFSKSNLLSKAIQQPEKARLVIDKIKTDGFFKTAKIASDSLQQHIPLGYCNVGEVIEAGENVRNFRVGDRVVSNGPHAEIVCIPVNLAAGIPLNVSDDEAVFTILGAVGLQGIRLLAPQIGDTVVVIGLGLIGLLTVQILQLNGCRVIGIEPDTRKREIAISFGIIALDAQKNDLQKKINELTDNIGADGVLITASSRADDIISLAARISRKRGKIVLIGSVGLNLKRSDFYEKELSFQVSCSYGPGRYDADYEEKGMDYPIGFVRWTENRNFYVILEMLSSGKLDIKPLISRSIDISDAEDIYAAQNQEIGTIINYTESKHIQKSPRPRGLLFPPTKVVAGIIGAGNFVRSTMLPILKNTGIKYIASASGLTAAEMAAKYKIPIATADYREILADREVDLVLIATRHDLHAPLIISALEAKKHVFVEKPLAICEQDLKEILKAKEKSAVSISVGFNRRFSLHCRKIKELTGGELMNVIVTVNAGYVESKSWVHDPLVGGGRVLGEGCHFIDLITYLTGSLVTEVCANAIPNGNAGIENANILLRYANGSTGVVNYFSNGHRSYSKERVEVHSGGHTLILDDFCELRGFGFKGFSRLKTEKNKGHNEQFRLLRETLKKGGEPIIAFDEIVNSTRATFAALESFSKDCWIQIVC